MARLIADGAAPRCLLRFANRQTNYVVKLQYHDLSVRRVFVGVGTDVLAFKLNRQRPAHRRNSEAETAERAVKMLRPADTEVGSCRNSQRRWRKCARRWAVGLTLAGMVSVARPVLAQGVSQPLMDFSIPSQPLAAALSRYGDATGNEALYEGGLTDGRISGDVQGRLTTAEALQRLLAGTGLSARFIAEDTFVLISAPQHRFTQTMPPAHGRYYALVQDGVLDALCRLRVARPGHYRLVTVFWIAQSGAVEDVLRIGTSGKESTDQLIDKTLRGLKFSEPPSDFMQPVRLLFLREGPGVKPGCAAVDARLLARGGAR